MKIISKRRAMTIYRQHPESRIFRYCTGKYQWHGSVCHYTGRDVPDIAGVPGYIQWTRFAAMTYQASPNTHS